MVGKRQWYRGYGLTIDSEFAIPGAVPVAPGVGQADIVIRAGDAAIGPVDAANGPYRRCGDALLADLPGAARYLAPSPSQLIIAPYPGADPDHVAELLIATALPMLLWMRGGFVLHAAGLIMPGTSSAIALAGPSGIGKSSLTHRLLADGARLVGDDTLLLSQAGERSMVSGLAASYFLPDAPGGQRAIRHVPSPLQADSAPLDAIIVLARSSQAAMQAAPQAPARIAGPAALEALLQNRHRPRVPAIMGRHGALMPVCAAHCRNVPIYRLDIAEGDLAGAQEGIAALVDGFRAGDAA